MAKRKNSAKKAGKNNGLPGTIYLNKNRYWWKVQLPGETAAKARPLKPAGSKFATTDLNVAVEVAKNFYQAAVFNSGKNIESAHDPYNDSLGTIARSYLEHCDEYYRQANGNSTDEPANIRYSLKPLVEIYGTLPVDEFGPLKLIEVQKKMIALVKRP